MVRTPVESTFTTGPPVIVPNSADDTTAAWAGPPRKFLVAEGGRFQGVITLADLMAYLAVLQDLGQVHSTGTAGRQFR